MAQDDQVVTTKQLSKVLDRAFAKQNTAIGEMFARQTEFIQEQFDEQNKKLDEHGRLLKEHGGMLAEHGRRLTAIEARLDSLEGKFEALENDIKEIYAILKDLQKQVGAAAGKNTELEQRVMQLEKVVHKIAQHTGVSLT